MLTFWSLCSRSLMYSSSVEESARLKEDHKKDINSTVVRLPTFVLDSKIVAEADVVAEPVEDMFPSFKCMVFCNGLWRDGNHETHNRSPREQVTPHCSRRELVNNGWEWHSRSTSTSSNLREVTP